MAKHDPKWTPDIEEAPTTHPKTRDQLVQEKRARRVAEPAAAPHETDSESGTAGAVPPARQTGRMRSHTEHAVETGQHDVRIGPGDAGAADTPTEATERVSDRRDSWSRALGLLALVALIGVFLALLF